MSRGDYPPRDTTYSLDVKLAKLLASSSARQQQGEERIVNVAMAPILTFDLRRGGDITSAEGLGRVGKEEDTDETKQGDGEGSR